MTFDNFDAVFYTSTFLLPGYIIKSIIDKLVPPSKNSDTKYFFTCLLYSIINCSVWSWLYKLLLHNSDDLGAWYWARILLITVVGAVILGVVIGIVKQRDCIAHLFLKLNINIINPIPTAWDYYFSKQEVSWIIVTLKNGTVIHGCYSTESFASSDSEERDLFIEQLYIIDENNCWVEVKGNNGVLISKDEISVIEFLKGDESDG